MRKKKYKRLHGKMTIIYISMITSLSLMGVGYAFWTNDLIVNANMAITTGSFDATYSLEDKFNDIDKVGFLDFNINDNILKVKGEVYQGFSHVIDINIVDNGTVPVVLMEIEEVDNKDEIAQLEKDKKYNNGFRTFGTFSKRDGNLYMSNSIQNEVSETLNLSIVPGNEESIANEPFGSMSMKISSSSEDGGEIDQLRNKIKELRHELHEYENLREKYNFEYNLLFEQEL